MSHLIRHALDLTQSHFCKARGDLTLYGTWFGDKRRPCLVVVPTFRQNYLTCKPLVVCIDDAWKWNPDDPDAMPEINALMVQSFLDQNGFDMTNTFTMMRVVSFIHDHLGDLLRIPPKPVSEIVVADAAQTDHATGKVTTREIIDRV